MRQSVRIQAGYQGKLFSLVFAVFVCAMLLGSASVNSSPGHVSRQNLLDLIVQSERILMATVEHVSDGFSEEGIPFTEVRLNVSESLKGDMAKDYVFRQFGLLPGTDNARVTEYPGISPKGFIPWESGESVLVFLQRPARITGLQTTVGLSQGKLMAVQGRFETRSGLSNLFTNLVVEADDLTPDQIDMLRNSQQTVETGLLLTLVRRAVNENWIGSGVMHYAN
jgi:hypothetical protein